MSSEKTISETEALQLIADRAEELQKELDEYPPAHVMRAFELYAEMMIIEGGAKRIDETCTMSAWLREQNKLELLPGDKVLLKKLRKEIPEPDELFMKAFHLIRLNLLLYSSRLGMSAPTLMNLLQSGIIEDDEEAFYRELERIQGNRKLPN